MPMKRSGLSVTDARRVMEIEDVFEATIASGFRNEAQSFDENLALDILVL